MLEIQIERVRKADNIDQIVVATSVDKSDDKIAKLCERLNTECFRGSLADVLDRFYEAAAYYQGDHIMRLTGDCPLIDPELLDLLVEFYLKDSYDYASNCFRPTYPNGLDAEIFPVKSLETAWKEAERPSHREHVTLFIRQQPDRFKIGSLENNIDLAHHRWTVDEKEDFELVRQIFEALYPKNKDFKLADILKFLDKNPGLCEMNRQYVRNEGMVKSFEEDREWIQNRRQE